MRIMPSKKNLLLNIFIFRNEGVVEFASYNDVKNVIEKLDGKELNGRAIKIVDDSRGGGSKRRSRSR